MRKFRVALAQINVTVGDLPGNTAKILSVIQDARAVGADLVAFPELTVPGYPPEDLLLKPQFLAENRMCMEQIAEESRGISVVVGFADFVGGEVYNAAAIAHDGKLAGSYHKQFLPN